VADLAVNVPLKVGRNAEQVIAAKPDLVVATPFSNKDLVKQLQDAGVTVAVTDLVESIDGQTENIRLLAYMYGEEAKGEELVKEVGERLAKIDGVVAKQDATKKPRVLFLQNNAYVSGGGSTGDGIIRRAGAINVAAENNISGTKQISLESIIRLNPDYIILTDSVEANPKGFEQITANPALAEVPAIKNKKYFGVKGTYLGTLSHWNIRGIEELAKILYPGQL
jgi:iron complex transport system substrate-binding protein